MSKARTLAGVVSTGAVLADGVVDASEIGSLTLPSGGDIVGTTAVQTLTNKTMDFNANTFNNFPTSPEIKTPTNVSPASGDTDIGETPVLVGSAYLSLYGVTMAAAQWQVSTVADFSTTVVDTEAAGTSVNFTVPAGVLTVSTTFFWRVRYKDADNVFSAFSTGTSFTTTAAFEPTVIGEAFGGGFYTGDIWSGSELHSILVAPKSSGENSSKQYKTFNDASPAATQTLNNGPAASASMNNASHPAAQFCEGLVIGGFSDWYLPARDELELCYRNLKPTTQVNNVSARSLSAYTYPEGNDVSGDTMGRNRNSDPLGAVYTSGNPAQTTVTAFITGGTEAFAAAPYWSSSEFSATSAWRQVFSNGAQDTSFKINGEYARAVRRFRKSPAIGEFYEGGFYAGAIVVGGVQYYVIVAPKATGENASVAFKTTNDASPAATQTLNNGFAATAAMVAAGNHPAAAFCDGLTINGFSDWYLPARDELELCYRNLKPTTTANNVSARSLSSYTYPEGNDVSGDIMGRNRNTPSTFMGYNASNSPVQTNVALFITGGTEAFAAFSYWSSSEFSATSAWRQSFNNGFQINSNKGDSYYARAVRRVPV